MRLTRKCNEIGSLLDRRNIKSVVKCNQIATRDEILQNVEGAAGSSLKNPFWATYYTDS